jgi:hypothetical protein
MRKYERRASQYWVAINRVTLPAAEWRYVVTDRDPAWVASSRLSLDRAFTYQAVQADLSELGIQPDLIPPECYFCPTADEKEEGAELIFREVPALRRWRK